MQRRQLTVELYDTPTYTSIQGVLTCSHIFYTYIIPGIPAIVFTALMSVRRVRGKCGTFQKPVPVLVKYQISCEFSKVQYCCTRMYEYRVRTYYKEAFSRRGQLHRKHHCAIARKPAVPVLLLYVVFCRASLGIYHAVLCGIRDNPVVS